MLKRMRVCLNPQFTQFTPYKGAFLRKKYYARSIFDLNSAQMIVPAGLLSLIIILPL